MPTLHTNSQEFEPTQAPDTPDATDTALLRSLVRQFCEEQLPPPSPTGVGQGSARTGEDGHDRVLWRRLASELELIGFSIPTEFGGSGFSWAQHAIVFEELGRVLTALPYFSTVALATTTLLASGDAEAMARYLPELAAGRRVATLATVEQDAESAVSARRVATGDYQLSGQKVFVLDGHLAGLILATAQVQGCPALFALESPTPGLRVEPMTSLDLTRAAARVELRDARARLVGQIGAAPSYLRRAFDLAGGALAAEQVGGMSRCLDLSVQYAAQRRQFNRAIGSFQAIKHKCVHMLVQLELARGLATDACITATADPDTRALASSAAQAFCADSYRAAAAATIHIHGGIGFTWEHEAHLHYRRAHANASLHINPRKVRDTVAEMCLSDASFTPNHSR